MKAVFTHYLHPNHTALCANPFVPSQQAAAVEETAAICCTPLLDTTARTTVSVECAHTSATSVQSLVTLPKKVGLRCLRMVDTSQVNQPSCLPTVHYSVHRCDNKKAHSCSPYSFL